MSFKIAFRGLMCHVEDGGETRTVLVKAAGHEPFLIVHMDDVRGALQGWKDEPVGVFHFLKLSAALKLDAPAIKLADAPVQTGFKGHVPSLKEVLDQDLDADVKKGNVGHPSVAASLQYGGGSLRTNGCFSESVTWSGAGGNPPRCVAREIIYEVVAGDVVKIHDAAGKFSVSIQENAMVWVTNRNKGQHFKEFTTLAKNSKLAREPKGDGKSCLNCMPSNTQPDSDVECSNTRYP